MSTGRIDFQIEQRIPTTLQIVIVSWFRKIALDVSFVFFFPPFTWHSVVGALVGLIYLYGKTLLAHMIFTRNFFNLRTYSKPQLLFGLS